MSQRSRQVLSVGDGRIARVYGSTTFHCAAGWSSSARHPGMALNSRTAKLRHRDLRRRSGNQEGQHRKLTRAIVDTPGGKGLLGRVVRCARQSDRRQVPDPPTSACGVSRQGAPPHSAQVGH